MEYAHHGDLLARHQQVAVVGVFHGALVEVARGADVVVGADDEAGPFPRQEIAQGLDLGGRRRLTGDVVVQAEHEQRIDVRQHAFVERQAEAGLVDPLENRHGMTGDLADQPLERNPGPEEQLQRA